MILDDSPQEWLKLIPGKKAILSVMCQIAPMFGNVNPNLKSSSFFSSAERDTGSKSSKTGNIRMHFFIPIPLCFKYVISTSKKIVFLFLRYMKKNVSDLCMKYERVLSEFRLLSKPTFGFQ